VPYPAFHLQTGVGQAQPVDVGRQQRHGQFHLWPIPVLVTAL
jgi:hypothetical protein